MAKVINAVAGILWLILGVAILTKTYTWFTNFANILVHTHNIILFWVGAVILVTVIVFIIPIYITVEAYKDQ